MIDFSAHGGTMFSASSPTQPDWLVGLLRQLKGYRQSRQAYGVGGCGDIGCDMGCGDNRPCTLLLKNQRERTLGWGCPSSKLMTPHSQFMQKWLKVFQTCHIRLVLHSIPFPLPCLTAFKMCVFSVCICPKLGSQHLQWLEKL